MAYYYIPLFTRDFTFENIFSTESISPASYYSRRNFGIDYFYSISDFEIDNALILYNAIPAFQIQSPEDGIKYVLAIDTSVILPEDMIVVGEGIIAVQKTIYLTKQNFLVYFFSERDMRLTIAKSATSLPTKSVAKYLTNFKYFENAAEFSFDTNSIRAFTIVPDETEENIVYDRKYNSIKGFLYGLACGIISEKSPVEQQLISSVQGIVNSGAEFRNNIENNNKFLDAKYNRAGIGLKGYQQKVLDNIQETENLLSVIFPEPVLSENEIAELLLLKFQRRLSSIEAARQYINFCIIEDELYATNKYDTLKKKLSGTKDNESPAVLLQSLKEIYSYALSSRAPGDVNKRLSLNVDRIKNALFRLNHLIAKKFSKNSENNIVPLEKIHYDYLTFHISIDDNFLFIQQGADRMDYSVVCNTILTNAKRNKGDAYKTDLLKIVEAVGTQFTKSGNIKESTLYQYLNNEIDSYDLEKVTSVVMRNFIAFVFNPDSLEKMEKFLIAKNINSKWMAFSFWCAFNGFANTSRTFLDPIFNVENHPMQDYMDIYLSNLRNDIMMGGKHLAASNKQSRPIQSEGENNQLIVRNFFDKFINEKFNLTLNDFTNMISYPKREDRVNFLKNRFKIDKNEAKKMLDTFTEFCNAPPLF